MNKLYDWLNKQIEAFLMESVKYFDKLGNEIISMLNQIIKHLLDETNT